MLSANVRVGQGSRPRRPRVEQVVEMGEHALGFDSVYILGAITDLYEFLNGQEGQTAVTRLQGLQKRLKYGLPSNASILLYEAGFSDRPLAIDLSERIPGIMSRAQMINALRLERQAVEAVLDIYPQHFRRIFERIIGT
jgi:hypothetical protein